MFYLPSKEPYCCTHTPSYISPTCSLRSMSMRGHCGDQNAFCVELLLQIKTKSCSYSR